MYVYVGWGWEKVSRRDWCGNLGEYAKEVLVVVVVWGNENGDKYSA